MTGSSGGPPVIRTARLTLRPYTAADVDTLHAMWTDPAVRRYLWDDAIIDRAVAAREVESVRRTYADGGVGQLLVVLSDGGVPIGFAGFREFHDRPQLELMFGLLPARWGQGYASEACRALLRYGFEQCGFEAIRASTDVLNVGSIRVLERLGMQPVRRRLAEGRDTIFYELSRDAATWGEEPYAVSSETA